MISDTSVPWYKSFVSDWIFTVLAIVFCAAAAFNFAEERIDPVKTDPPAPAADVQSGKPVTTSVALTRAAAVAAPADAAPTKQPTLDDGRRRPFRLASSLAVAWVVLWGMFAFTGDAAKRRIEGFKFAYFFVIASFAVFTLPPLLKNQAIGSEPIGIVSGCVTDAKASDQVRCLARDGLAAGAAEAAGPAGAAGAAGAASAASAASAAALPAPAKLENNQWLVNIGGALTPHTASPGNPACAGDDECKLGSTQNRAMISGGLVVPLPFVIIALIGGAISLSRRVPEIQQSSDPSYVGSATEPGYGPTEARERLVFQIMQFISAPMIAVVAYQVIDPDSDATAAGLAFMCGFGSEAILLMIRGFVDAIRPGASAPPEPATGAITGVVTGNAGPVANAEVSVLGSTTKVSTDSVGRFLFPGVLAGVHQVTASADGGTATVTVSVPAGGSVPCAITLPDSPASDPAEESLPGDGVGDGLLHAAA